MGFPRQEHWSGLEWSLWFPSPGDLPDPGIEPRVSCIALQVHSVLTEPPGVFLTVTVFASLTLGEPTSLFPSATSIHPLSHPGPTHIQLSSETFTFDLIQSQLLTTGSDYEKPQWAHRAERIPAPQTMEGAPAPCLPLRHASSGLNLKGQWPLFERLISHLPIPFALILFNYI